MNAQDLQDREAIRDLLTRYTYNGDRGRIDALAACFTDEGLLEFPGGSGTGPDAIISALSSGTRNPALTFVRHHITNPLISVDGDRATVRSYFQVFSNIGLDHAGTYSDDLHRTPKGWRFIRRLVRVDWQSSDSLFRPMVSR